MVSMPLQLPLVAAVFVAALKDRADLVAENVALRHQLSCLKHRKKRPKLRPLDRALWVVLARSWSRWKELLVMVKPATFVAWHKKGFSLFWRWKSRKRGPGRPRVHKDVRKLIVEMAVANVGWGAPRIHGELAQAGHRDIRDLGIPLYAKARSATRIAATMAHVPAQSHA
jgi:putative transposase